MLHVASTQIHCTFSECMDRAENVILFIILVYIVPQLTLFSEYIDVYMRTTVQLYETTLNTCETKST